MPDPGFTRPDLCSIRAAAGQAELAEAACGRLNADGQPPACYDPPAPTASGIDRAIRLSTAAAVLAVAGIAAYVFDWHADAVVRVHGETGITARLEPAIIDGLVDASSMAVLYAAWHRVPVPSLAAGRSRWASPLPSRRTWPRAGPTVPSGRSSRPGRRLVLWARTNSWSGSSAPPGRQHAGRRQSTPATVRPAALRRVPSRPQPCTGRAPRRDRARHARTGVAAGGSGCRAIAHSRRRAA